MFAGRVASDFLKGASVGTAAHIIIPSSDMCSRGVGQFRQEDGRKEEHQAFIVWALFYGEDEQDDEAEGAMVKFFVERYLVKNYEAISNPRWAANHIGHAQCFGYPIKHKHIRAAIERDADIFSA